MCDVVAQSGKLAKPGKYQAKLGAGATESGATKAGATKADVIQAAPAGTEWLIDVRRFINRGERIEGQLSGKQLPRLRRESTKPLTPVTVQVVTAKSPRGRPGMRVTLHGTIRMICQRCLKSMDVALSAKAAVEWVATQAELDAADADDHWDAMLMQDHFDLLPFLEDELLLAVPFAPLHADCEAAGRSEAGEKVSPFAVLAGLKKLK